VLAALDKRARTSLAVRARLGSPARTQSHFRSSRWVSSLGWLPPKQVLRHPETERLQRFLNVPFWGDDE